MKKGNIIFIVPAMLMLALGSCTKGMVEEGLAGEELVAVGGERVITLFFSESTKVTFEDGPLTPHFSAGDRVMVYNSGSREICTVFLAGEETPTISTSLSGTLSAVFPADCASLSGNSVNGITVPAVQSGRFADAVIATADNIGSSNTATFESQTAILRFYVDKKIGVQSVSVTSSATDIATGSRSITVTAPSGSTLDAFSDDPDRRLCYVSVLKDVNANTLTFSGLTNTQGLVTKSSTKVETLAAGKIYNAFLPYYVDLGAGGKWGYCNIGAFLPEENGLYFAWGETTGHNYKNGDVFIIPDSSTRYNETDCRAILLPEDDAATVNWGADWRMPAGDYSTSTTEFYSMLQTTYWGYYSGSWDSDYKGGLYVFLLADAPGKTAGTFGSVDGLDLSKAKLFFPLTGYVEGIGSGASVRGDNSFGYYWSSLLFDYNLNSSAWSLQFSGASDVNCNKQTQRNWALAIRPVCDDTIHPVESNPMIDGGTY